nr:N-6 DNA methylase [Agrobacterium vitis]
MFREIRRQIDAYDFSEVREDILKGVYQELIDLETRHALGEYYTPDWLCERMMEELPLEQSSSVLDPACGSGSFLRAAIARLREQFPDLGAEKLAEQVVGIDRGGSVRMNSFGRFVKWISASIMPPPSLVPAR